MTATNTATLPPAGERQGIILWAGQHFGIDAGKVLPILKATCFKGQKEGGEYKEATDAEVAALLIVAREHKLNPFLKEIYAFPAKGGGIVPIVGIDGWISMANNHPQYSGVEFIYEQSAKPAWIECHIHRKDRQHPIKVRELMAECKRGTGPWESHPTRMLRHKAFIQCARLAFGFAGIYDPDEGETIAAGRTIEHQPPADQQQRGAAGLRNALIKGPEDTAGTGAEKVVEKAKPEGTVETRDEIVASYGRCSDTEALDLVADTSREFQWTEADQAVLTEAYTKRRGDLGG